MSFQEGFGSLNGIKKRFTPYLEERSYLTSGGHRL